MQEYSKKELDKSFNVLIKSLKETNSVPETLTYANALLHLGYALYDHPDNQVDRGLLQSELCKKIKNKILDKVLAMATKEGESQSMLYETWLKLFALSARRSLEQFLLYYGLRNDLSIWRDSIHLFRGFIYYVELQKYTETVARIILSMPPGCGKSFILDSFTAWSTGGDGDSSFLRISYSDDNATNSSENIRNIMATKAFAEVFPEYAKYRGKTRSIFQPNQAKRWKTKMAKGVSINHYAIPRRGQITGKRAETTILDDLIKGFIEADNPELKQSILNWYWTDVHTRKHAGKEPKMIAGNTVWSDDDLLETMRNQQPLYDTEFPFTQASEDNVVISIKIPAIDYVTGKNNVSYAHSDKYLQEMKNNLPEHFWMALYQSAPLPPTGMDFAYEKLYCYESLPDDGAFQGMYATLDPARKGKNYVSMPIFQKMDKKFYLVDAVFQKKAMNELYEVIVEKIIFHNIACLHLENNTDTSLAALLTKMLKEKDFTGCIITEVFSTGVKEIRIANERANIKNYLRFPPKGLPEKTDIGMWMANFTKYSFDKPNAYDDAPDSAALFTQKFCTGVGTVAKLKAVRNPLRR